VFCRYEADAALFTVIGAFFFSMFIQTQKDRTMNHQTLFALAASLCACAGASAQFCEPVNAQTLSELINPYQKLGSAVDVSGDRMIVGAPNNAAPVLHFPSNPGLAKMYEFDGTQWVSVATLEGDSIGLFDHFGAAVAIDGDHAMVGAPLDDHSGQTDPGSVFPYRFDGTQWVALPRIIAPDASTAADDLFGDSIAISGNLAVIGAPFDKHQSFYNGSVYFYEFDGSEWVFVTKIDSPTPELGREFGQHIEFDGDRVLVGAPRNPYYFDASLYIYEDLGSGWELVDSIAPRVSDLSVMSHFGGFAVSDDYLVLGMDFIDERRGGAVVYERDGSDWVYQQTIYPPTHDPEMFYGWSVVVDSELIVLGSVDDRVSFYRNTAQGWVFEQELVLLDSSNAGYALDLHNDSVILGAPSESLTARRSGAVHIYELNCVSAECAADFTGDGTLDIFDVFAFLDAFNAGDLDADFTGDGTLDIFDVFDYLDAFEAGCP
jgi:hypothetical protein